MEVNMMEVSTSTHKLNKKKHEHIMLYVLNSFYFISSSILHRCYIQFLSFFSFYHYPHLNLFYHYHFFLCGQIVPLFFFFFISIFDLIFCFSPLNLNFCLHSFFLLQWRTITCKKVFLSPFSLFPRFSSPLLPSPLSSS